MIIDDKLVTYLEELSRLRLSEREKEKIKGDMGKILRCIEKLSELDTVDMDAISHPFEFTNNFREDEVYESTDRDLILKNSPEQKDGCFKVPKTVE